MSGRRVRVDGEAAAGEAVRLARELALAAGLSSTDASHVATAVSEIALNQVRHAGGGTVHLRATPDGVLVEAADRGPGIADVRQAMLDGFSTAGSLGLGLPGARRLMDEFQIDASAGRGVRVRMAKWTASARAPLGGRRLADTGAVDGRLRSLVVRWPAGLLLALAPESGTDALRADASAPPHVLLERLGGTGAALASLSALDGRLAWRAEAGSTGLLRRSRGDRAAVVGTAPRLRDGAVTVLRDDVLVLASFPLGDLPAELPPGAGDVAATVAAAAPAGTPAPAVLAAVFRRGAHEAAAVR